MDVKISFGLITLHLHRCVVNYWLWPSTTKWSYSSGIASQIRTHCSTLWAHDK